VEDMVLLMHFKWNYKKINSLDHVIVDETLYVIMPIALQRESPHPL
jgi:hypothetical protein